MKGLYIGRFDPFHLGHLKAYKLFRSLISDIKVGIGAQRQEDYFTLDERIEMVIQNTGINPICVGDLSEEHPFYWDWGGYVLNQVGEVDMVATGNDCVKEDFSKCGIPILWLPRYECISGTKIRELISLEDISWMNLVPEKTRVIIENSRKFKRSLK